MALEAQRPRLSRREFLIRTAEIVGVAAAAPFVEMVPSSILLEPYTAKPKTADPKLELPNDIVEDDVLLKDYATTIHNLDKIKFFVRQRALEEEPIFKWLNKYKGEGASFAIVLIDGPGVGTPYFSPEQKELFDKAHLDKITETQIGVGQEFFENPKAREIVLDDHKRTSAQLEQLLKDKKIDKKRYDDLKRQVAEHFRPFLQTPTREDMLRVGGEANRGMLTINSGKLYLLVAVGKSEPEKKNELPKSFLKEADMVPHPSQSFPSLEDYANIVMKKIQALTPGPVVRHEFGHADVDGRGRLIRVPLETAADQNAYSRLEKAIEALMRGNDSLFYFGFLTEEGTTLTKKFDQLLALQA